VVAGAGAEAAAHMKSTAAAGAQFVRGLKNLTQDG
jgi:hypothetical protein